MWGYLEDPINVPAEADAYAACREEDGVHLAAADAGHVDIGLLDGGLRGGGDRGRRE